MTSRSVASSSWLPQRACRAHAQPFPSVRACRHLPIPRTQLGLHKQQRLPVSAAAAAAADEPNEELVKRDVGLPAEAQGMDRGAPPAPSGGISSPAPSGGIRSLQDLEEYPKEFVFRRWIVFLGIVIGYASYYLTRNSLTYTAPVMVADASLKMDITQVGSLTSLFPIAYGMSKFVSGVLGARTSPTLMLAGGLMATAVVNLLFGAGNSMPWFLTFWAINGILQGFGGPCCARILTAWYATKERGTYWGMWNIAHNLGGFSAPILAGTAARMYGWKYGMWAPGAVGLVVGFLLLVGVRDSPEAIGQPPVEVVKPKEEADSDAPAEPKPSLLTLLVQNVLRNPFIWGMALTYFFVYVVRQGVTSWFVFYLIKAKGVADAGSAAFRVSGMELGGLFGSLLAGRISDKLIARDPKGGNVGKRVQVVMGYTVGIAAMLAAFYFTPASMPKLQWATVFMIGFFLYGPQMLIGLCGAELVGPESVGASEGFLGWIAYLGAANAGIPLSIIVKQYGWEAYFVALLAACAMVLLLMAPMVNLKSFVQREARGKKKVKAA